MTACYFTAAVCVVAVVVAALPPLSDEQLEPKVAPTTSPRDWTDVAAAAAFTLGVLLVTLILMLQ